MAIRLLALDLDGTLLNPRGQLTERNRQAIAEARARDVHVALCTGRRFRDARPIALELGLDVPLISHNGALTKHAETLETVAVLPLPLPAAQNAVRVGQEFGADALVSDDHDGLGVLVYDHLSGDNPSLLRYIAWARRVHGEEGAQAIREVPSLAAYLDHEPVHIAFSGGCAAINELGGILRTELGATAKLLNTMYPAMDFALLDIIHPQASKGVGVAAAAAELGIARAEVMAVGDNFNDLEMLEFAGTGVVMANADKSLRERSDFHPTASNAEDGVALAIEKFILNSEH
jgi:hydroxymethylpyrimidine pyrophosphatase-like HAD family hydrolase